MATEPPRILASRVILTLGVVGGAALFLIAVRASFVLNSINLVSNLVALFCCVLALPITIAAIWKPKLSAAWLLLTFLLLECAIWPSFGFRGVFQVALRLGLPIMALASGYVYVASVRSKHAGT
jgi:hypothetical protein